jgi:hypothetical protein
VQKYRSIVGQAVSSILSQGWKLARAKMARADLNHSSESEVVRHPTMRSLFIGTQWESATLCPV